MVVICGWNKGYYLDIGDIPTKKTYKDLLRGLDVSTCQNNNYIELNKFHMAHTGPLNGQDYEVFWACMKLYEVYGINYFSAYIELLSNSFGSFYNGIEAWFSGENDLEELGYRNCPLPSQLLRLVNILHFFCIESYQGIPIANFDAAAANANKLYQIASQNMVEERKERTRAKHERKTSSYFNYGNYSSQVFKTQFDHFALMQGRHSISIDEAIEIAKQATQQMYIVLFERNGKVCYVGKTEHPLSYIGAAYKRHDADRVWFDHADCEYVDDLLIAMKFFYDLPLKSICPTGKNRKYATVKQAIFAYRKVENISKKTILKAINENKLRVIDLGNGQELIDKIELQRALYHVS